MCTFALIDIFEHAVGILHRDGKYQISISQMVEDL